MLLLKQMGTDMAMFRQHETALSAGASYLAVAFIDEAILLRKKGIKAPILVLGASRPEDISVAAQYDITLTVFQADWLRYVKEHVTINETGSCSY